MLQTGRNRSKRIVSTGRLLLRPFVVALVGAVVFAASALAAPPTASANIANRLARTASEPLPETTPPAPTPEVPPAPTPEPPIPTPTPEV
ncbi:MAG TPA: hypothetical protein VNZ01_12940, partial [Solirubrobacteraceae bacterium]|nr:hypothetical protein [Solirubrobacteraceae bacterium]